tara:strand:+ start:94 stop:774 length:681 start_codon:yes stop_codon:yes gene_type:complete
MSSVLGMQIASNYGILANMGLSCIPSCLSLALSLMLVNPNTNPKKEKKWSFVTEVQQFKSLAIFAIGLQTVTFATQQFCGVFMTFNGLSMQQIGFRSAICTLIGAVTGTFSNSYKNIDKRNMLYISVLVLSACQLSTGWLPLMLKSYAYHTAVPLLLEEIHTVVVPRNRATVMSVISLCKKITSSLFVMGFTCIIDKFGILSGYLFSSLCLSVGATAFKVKQCSIW